MKNERKRVEAYSESLSQFYSLLSSRELAGAEVWPVSEPRKDEFERLLEGREDEPRRADKLVKLLLEEALGRLRTSKVRRSA